MTGTTTQTTAGKRPKPPKRPKHVPQRTCVACRLVKPKRELLRIVRTPQGRVEIDPLGKKSGRGAYLCATRACWQIGLKKKRLEQELEVTLTEEDRLALETYAASLPTPEAVSRAAKATNEPAS